jgi:hypothetical protein
MARNVLQSFQKALDWNSEAWIGSASATLVKRARNGPERGLRLDPGGLLEAAEAKLIHVANYRGSDYCDWCGRSFRVLSQRVE